MNPGHFAPLRRALAVAGSRREVFSVLTGGLLAAGPLVRLADGGEGRKRGKRRHRKRKRNGKNRNGKSRTRLDATCPGPADFSLADSGGNNRFAQTFIAKSSGPLISAELSISKEAGSPGDYVLRLSPVDSSGHPTNEVLAETSVANADVPDGGGMVPFTFAAPPSVKASRVYALVLTRTEGTFGWGARSGDACAGGAFRSPDQTAPFIEGVGGLGNDFIFSTFVRS